MKTQFLATIFTGVSLALALPSAAAIVWFPGEDIAIPTNPTGVSINLETAANAPTDDLLDADLNLYFGGTVISNDADATATLPSFQPVRLAGGSLDTIDNMTIGATVDGASTLASGYGGSTDHIGTQFTAGTPGYIGFSLDHSTLGTVYGWMRVTLNPNTSEGTVHEWAYEDSGSSIPVGAIPEPTTSLLAVLALGGLALRRRR